MAKNEKEEFKLNYEDFENFIKEQFNKVREENDSIIIGILSNTITITRTELKQYFNNCLNYKIANTTSEIYNAKQYEVAIERSRFMLYDLNLNDPTHNITYSTGTPTTEYCCRVLLRLAQQCGYKRLNKIRMNIVHSVRLRKHISSLTTAQLLASMLGSEISTLKINSSGKERNYEEWCKLKQSLIFIYSYNTGCGLVENNLLDNDTFKRVSYDKESDMIPPKRIYNPVLVDYYKKALSSTDPFIQYISFYHVLECCYDKAFNKKIVQVVRDSLAHPDFRYTDDSILLELANKIRSFKMDSSNTYPNESEALVYVLKEAVDIHELHKKLKALQSEEEIKKFEKSPTFFNKEDSSKSTLNFSQLSNSKNKDAQTNLLTNLRNRIYATRNALVHSKEREEESNYRVFENEKELRGEIPLIKSVAEQVIIHFSEDFS